MKRCPTVVSELVRCQRLALAAILALSAACSHATTAADAGTSGDDADVTADVDDQELGDTAGTDDVTDASVGDTGPDVPKVDVQDVQADEVTQTECKVDSDCYSKINITCQTITCDGGKCSAPTLKPGANVCCSDSDCPALSCQTAACNTGVGQCEYKPTPNCCADKTTILPQAKFETQGNLEGFTGTVATTASGSTVAWQVSPKRAHTGKSSIYLGNECYNYDTSATAASSCQSTGAAAKVTAKLVSPEMVIPKDSSGKIKPAILHYWLWLDAEPPFLAGNAGLAGTTCGACAIDQVCVNFGNGAKDACLTEKDVLTVSVNGSNVAPSTVWSSTKIDKTTGGKWVHRVINLAGFGASATVTWTFNTIDGTNNGFEGVYLDDIVAETLCATDSSTCDSGTTCKSADGNPCAINQCTYYDNVTDKGICFGDLVAGCCAGVADCQDNNNCTIDSCAITGGAATGICANVPDSKNAQCCLPENLYSDAFENGISTWKNIGSNSTSVFWRVNPTGGTNGTKSLVFTDSTFQSYADPKLLYQGPKGTICSPEVELKSGTLYDVVNFQISLATEWCGQANYKNPLGSLSPCTTDVECTTVGETCNTTMGFCALSSYLDRLAVTFYTGGQFCGLSGCSAAVGNVKTPLWTSDDVKGCTQGKSLDVEVALDQFAGKKGRVCFTYDAGDASGNNYAGPSIDDFVIGVTCEKKQCTNDAFCAALGNCKPIAEDATCGTDGQCACIPNGKCVASTDCDDKDSCTVDTCLTATNSCDHVLTAGCCSEKTQIQYESFEDYKGQLPPGWVSSYATAAFSGTGEPYDATMKWHISSDNLFGTSPDQYSLFFGNALGNYDAGAGKVPYGLVTSGPIDVPLNGTTIVSFHLSLSTEWDSPAVFEAPIANGTLFAIDRLRVGFADAADPTQITWAWSSYDIGGTTNGQWSLTSAKVPSALAGKKVLLAYEFDAGTSKNNNHGGAYIDGIRMWTTCTAPTCVADAECAPPAPDTCKAYLCKMDEAAKTFACDTQFKPGPGCCQPTSPLPAVTFENTTMSPLTGTCTPGVLVNWQVVPHQYMTGKYEAYMGNPAKWNYDDPVAGCGGVTCSLSTPVLQMGTNVKKSAQLQFSIWADIEPPTGSFQPEHFRVLAKYGSSVDVLWDATDPKTGLKPDQYLTKQAITLPLTQYQGLNIVIDFEFTSGDCSLNDKNKGVFLDDVQVTEPCTL